MKGQVRIEFVFGLVVYTVIVLFIASQVKSNFTSITSDSYLDTTKAKALNIINHFIYDLSADGDITLSEVQNIDCVNFESTYDILGYRLTIFRSDTEVKFCGAIGDNPIVSIERDVIISSEPGLVRLELL